MNDPRRDIPTDAELERMLAEAEGAVSQLRRELALMRSRELSQAQIEAQLAEIERLSEHLSQAQVRWGEVWRFFEAALLELRSRDAGSTEQSGRPVDDGPDRGPHLDD